MRVSDLTTDELKILIRETVIETLEELLPDPDQGKTVKEDVKQELLSIQKRRDSGERGLSRAEAMKVLGLSDP